jgi:hypothetical protein
MTQPRHHILEKNLFAVFGQRDPEQRRATIDELYTETCIFVEPTGVVTGRDAVHALVEDLLVQNPTFVFSQREPADGHHDVGRLSWGFGPEGEPPAVTGMDVAIFEDGRISTLYVFLDKQPE